MSTQTIELSTSDGPMEAFEAFPTELRRRATGHRDPGSLRRERAHRGCRPPIRCRGYHVAPALFHRAGGGTAPYDDFAK
jgi:hypothetical protein